jgi:hypothetical protein
MIETPEHTLFFIKGTGVILYDYPSGSEGTVQLVNENAIGMIITKNKLNSNEYYVIVDNKIGFIKELNIEIIHK